MNRLVLALTIPFMVFLWIVGWSLVYISEFSVNAQALRERKYLLEHRLNPADYDFVALLPEEEQPLQ
jgi:hypothetical protein